MLNDNSLAEKQQSQTRDVLKTSPMLSIGAGGEGANKAAANAWLTELLVQAAPPAYKHSLSQPAVQGTALENLFALITGNKAKRPVETLATSQKLCKRIASCTLPANIIIPVILGVYNGTTNPDDFLQIFEGAMKTQHWSDEVACHLFPTVLQSAAREWFAKLPPNGITCFADLREKFLMQYQNLHRHTYTHLYDYEIPMYRGEKIESFITRYMLKCLKISGLPETHQIFEFITCLDKDAHPSLVSELRWNISGTFAGAVMVAMQYQHSRRERHTGYHREERKREEERRSDSRHRHNSSRRSESHSKNHNSRGKSHDSHRHDKSSRKPYDKGSLIDSLSKTPREILLTKSVKAKFTPPAPLEKRDGQKSDKYCEFHEDNGHDTDECKALIREIIAKIKAGELNHLLS
ncbi:uncharacterized protein [Rutidosis leptorrhynchoides]|uniref:uncharacterized protein n=1 Tax=Rutidosis leptorrhynchoides TaxID=125765 RepID=UPI003A98FBC2